MCTNYEVLCPACMYMVLKIIRLLFPYFLSLENDLLNDLNAIDCNITDVINFSSSQFTRLVDSLNSNFIVEERLNIYLLSADIFLSLFQKAHFLLTYNMVRRCDFHRTAENGMHAYLLECVKCRTTGGPFKK